MPLVPPPPRAASRPPEPTATDVPSARVLAANQPEWSVGDLAAALKRTLEDAFGHVRLRGEISGYRGQHGSGHAYFSLKDGQARIDAVVWKGVFGRLRQKPQEGLEVVATGRITTFAGKSSYQIVVESLEPAGLGAWMALLEERKRVLAAEGLFDPAHRKPIPYLPRVVGVVTSPTGAVIRDILHRLADRFPRPVLVWPVRVQGEGAAEEVAAAIRGFNALAPNGPIPRPDVLIVARGGGSIEDLWSFNEECVVRAAHESRIPLISAVGHETDTTLIDFAADKRAPTPTAAAEMAVPVRADLQRDLLAKQARVVGALDRLFRGRRERISGLARGLNVVPGLVQHATQRLDDRGERLEGALHGRFRRLDTRLAATRVPHPRHVLAVKRGRIEAAAKRLGRMHPALGIAPRAEMLVRLGERLPRLFELNLRRNKTRLETARRLLESHSYKGVLERGYVVVRDDKGKPIRSADAVSAGDSLQLEFADGKVGTTVTGGDAPEAATKPARKRSGDGRQGSLL